VIDRTSLAGRDYIESADWSVAEIDEALAAAAELKESFRRGEPHRLLPDKTLFMLFLDKSTRTRNAFEAGMTQLGGHAHYLDAEKTQVAHGESPKDMGIILSSYGHGIAIRHDLVPYEGNAYLREVARWASVPVINLQCDVDHPTQTLADLMTLRELRGENLRGLRIAVSWAYAPSYAKPLSVPQGLATLLPRFGMDVVVAHPPGFDLMPEARAKAEEAALQGGGSVTYTEDMDEAFAGADVVYPKSWGRLDAFSREAEALAQSAAYRDWICDARRMSLAAPGALYMHCLPADRENEVTGDVIDGPQSVVYQEAENRLHTGKALLALTMAGAREHRLPDAAPTVVRQAEMQPGNAG
jgi:ornithine carbamoyltransferase